MKKRLLALAALAVCTGAAQAEMTITGRASLGVSSYSATGSTSNPAANDVAARTRVDDYGSRLRFEANKEIGNGLRGFAVYELGLNLDTGTGNGQTGTANSATAFNGSRESHVGIGNETLELRIGRQNVYWTEGDLNQTGANFTGKDSLTDMYNGGGGYVGANVRQNNILLLQMNSGGGFAGSQVYWGPETIAEAAPAGSGVASATNASAMGFKINYDTKGAIHLMADYQKRSAITNPVADGTAATATNTFDNTVWKVAAGYRYATGSIVALHYWSLKKEYIDAATNAAPITQSFTSPFGGTGGRQQTGYGINLVHNFGNELYGYAQYGISSNYTHTAGGADLADSGTTGYSIGVRKNLSKDYAVFSSYGAYQNSANATLNFAGGGFSSATAVSAGSDPTYFLIGVQAGF
jgi:predicted porin